MEILTVTDIIEEDFGCEGRPAGQEPKVTVVARDSAGGERQFVIPTAWPTTWAWTRA